MNAQQQRIQGRAVGHDVLGDEFAVPELERPSLLKRLRKPLLLAAPIILIAVALMIYLGGGRYQVTDNAYIQSGRVAVSTNVAGRVIAIDVAENQSVKRGDILFRLDPTPFDTAVQEAEAQLSAARQGVAETRAQIGQGQSELAAARDRATFTAREAARQKALLAEGISSQAQYDQAALAALEARQAIQTTGQRNAGVLANLAGGADAPVDRQPEVRRAAAMLARARLNRSYTIVRAAQDGIVTKVNQLQVGNYLNPAQPVFSLVGRRIWIEANFKEDQLDHMRLNQAVTVKVDAFPSLRLTGRVTSFSPGTGNSFSVLPAENATGNWVKVVQRLPAQITLDRVPADVPLHAGLSATVSVDTQHRRHLFGSATDAPPVAP